MSLNFVSAATTTAKIHVAFLLVPGALSVYYISRRKIYGYFKNVFVFAQSSELKLYL